MNQISIVSNRLLFKGVSRTSLIRTRQAALTGQSSIIANQQASKQRFSTQSQKCEEITIPVPWGHISCKAWGDQSGDPILGIPGWSDNAGTFDRLVPLLPKDSYFVAVDLPGHGLSSHLPLGVYYTYLDFLLSTRRVIQHLQWDSFSIIGHSMGGGIGALYSSVFHEDVKNLVLLDLHKNIGAAHQGDYADTLNEQMTSFLALEEKLVQKKIPSYTYEDAISRMLAGTLDALDEPAAKILMVRGARKVENDRYEFTRDIRLNNLFIQRYTNNDIFDIMGNIKCRLLFLKAEGSSTGSEDESVVERTLDLYTEKCSEFRHVILPGNHFMHLINAPETAVEINKFLANSKMW